MKHLYLIILITSLSISANAQLSTQEKPLSVRGNVQKNRIQLPSAKLPAIPTEKLLKEDEEFPTPLRYAKVSALEVDILSEAEQIEVENGTVYLYQIAGENAHSLQTTFDSFYLPKGVEVYLYNEHMTLGAFTSSNNKPYKSLTTQDIPGNEVTVELFVPANAGTENISLTISGVSQAYRDIFTTKDTKESVFIDVNCQEGDNWQLEKHAVAKMTYQRDESSYLCTGALVNNTAEDGTPYFLTAYHCLNTTESAATLVTYFNYERNDCNGTTSNGLSLSGASLKSTLADSDFTLLLLDETPTAAYKPYYAGWDRTENEPNITIGIHHPGGDYKKISVDFDPAFSYEYEITWDGDVVSPPNSHWVLEFDRGATAGGSSGSPLFNQKGQIIGQLHGGSEGIDFYGKFSYSWSKIPSAPRSLYLWLDPAFSGVNKLDGYFPDNNRPDAHFTVELTNPCINAPLKLENKSLFQQQSYLWSISPASFSYLEGTSATSFEPVVQFEENVPYTISLTTKYLSFIDIRSRKEYIQAANTIKLTPIDTLAYGLHLGLNGDIFFHGAENFTWQLPSGLSSDDLTADTLRLNLTDQGLQGQVNYPVTAIGQHGTCADTVSFIVPVIFNDSLQLAHELVLDSVNGPFHNFFATTQNNEPNPPGDDCESQTEWCPCDISENILDNSVWFAFTAPESGVVGINTTGFDNQIALYEAENVSDLLSGDPSKYNLIAASDDIANRPDYSAAIFEANVIPDKRYWLQVDGSACGDDGLFFIEPLSKKFVSTSNSVIYEKQIHDVHYIYPNPVKDIIHLTTKNQSDFIREVKVFNRTGILIAHKLYDSDQSEADIQIGHISTGIYFLLITSTENQSVKKIIVTKD